MKTRESRNVTLSLPEPLLREFKIYAAERHQSMSALMQEALRNLMSGSTSRLEARQRMFERMRTAKDRGTKGRITWTREELHER
ncbi:MAG: ribbon-helix-helix protein, CopG family [Bryobacterales bacterium]|nr:ribbon-helix-helix protein, CopG family [Bryobacterales bacterium]